ncbi:hypothetical protein VE25_04260 [Devosia geojensis]|uniref:OmpA-like domain-containing protein n=1 Tax=Devosia geojensis TaxID=443610 RepID=A0A0F5FXX3_9HYPH|nr:hypothetical protein VE25_04260 [Devosia geojensis]
MAPVLDSAKDAAVAPVEGQPAEDQPVEGQPAPEVDASAEAPAPAEPVAPPTTDVDAQAQLAVEQAAIVSATEEAGERMDIQSFEPVTVPQNVTIINQTNVTNITNNTVTNNVTNNVQNNNINVNYGDVLTQVIVEVGNQLIINNRGQDTERFIEYDADEVYYERLGNGRIRETVLRPDGTQIVTVRNRNGDILRRSRITPDGREYILSWFDDRYYDDLLEWRDPARELPPLRLNIPVSEYVLDARRADQQQIETFFAQPPVEQVTRLYSIDEVKRSARVRDMVRRLEIGNLTFETGSANVGRDQVNNLSAVAGAMLDLLARNPAETFLIEGHTDAVGSDISNLELSDRRAGTVARILTDFYGVPPENLATQGYGERYLKIRTERAERENRRVMIRRITPLVTPYVASAQ